LLAILFLGVALWGPAASQADDKGDGKADAQGDGKADAAAQPAAAPKRKPLLPEIEASVKPFKGLVEAARQYFDLDEEQWRGRTAFVKELEQHAAAHREFLKDMDALRWLVYQGRSFEPQLTERKWQKVHGVTEAKSLAGTLRWLKSEDLTLMYSIPKSYPKKDKDLRNKIPRVAPFPLLLTMHEKRDYTGQRYPGLPVFKRRYPKKTWSELYEQWIVLCPIAAAGNFLEKNGAVRSSVFSNAFAEFWRHYNLDFERVVLDGTEQAFNVVTSMPVYFAGVVFNGKWNLKDDKQKALVPNFRSVPVYVVNNPKLADQLKAAGHPDVTAGIGGATLKTWMAARRRVTPKTIHWTIEAERYDQVLPYWINLDGVKWSAKERHLDVEVVDTKASPNTIRIQARGITTLSMFLNDDIVDLDRKVRVEINGHVEYDAKIEPQEKALATLGRDFDFLFNREPVRIRLSMFFGWLTPARIVDLGVRPPAKVKPKDEPKKAAVPKASPDEEVKAERFWNKARKLRELGNLGGACKTLMHLLDLPENKHTAEAKVLHEAIRAQMKKEAEGK